MAPRDHRPGDDQIAAAFALILVFFGGCWIAVLLDAAKAAP